jgi:hypothetical protein
MAWTESGLFFATWRDTLKQVAGVSMSLVATGNNIALTNNTETPDFISATDPSTWTNANEVVDTSGNNNWPTGGINLVTGTYAPTVTQSPSKTLMWDMNNISIANTTITGAYGSYIYANALTPKAKIIGVWFGGTGYSTVLGTFAITWNVLGIMTIVMAA